MAILAALGTAWMCSDARALEFQDIAPDSTLLTFESQHDSASVPGNSTTPDPERKQSSGRVFEVVGSDSDGIQVASSLDRQASRPQGSNESQELLEFVATDPSKVRNKTVRTSADPVVQTWNAPATNEAAQPAAIEASRSIEQVGQAQAAPVEAPLLIQPTEVAASVRAAPWTSGVWASGVGEEERTVGFFRDVVGRALALSPELRQAGATWQAALSDVDQAKGQRWPQVVVGASSPSRSFGPNRIPGDDSDRPESSVQVVTPVYDFGVTRHTIAGQTNAARAQEYALEQAYLAVSYDTVSALLEKGRYEEALKISDAYVSRMRELVEMLSQIAGVDPGRGSEVVQARSRLLQAETSRDLVVARLEEVRATLARLVGEDVEIPRNMAWDIGHITAPQALEGLQDHPSLQQAHWEAEAARSTAASVKAARMPKINWVVGRSTEEDVFGHSEPWTSGLTMEWRAFQGGSAAAAQRAANERANASEARMDSLRREAEYRIRNLAQQRDLAVTRTTDYEVLLLESDRVRKMFFEQWHHLGKRTLLDVLIAENEYYSHQISATNSFFDSKAADLRLRAEAGILMSWLDGGASSSLRKH